MKKIFWKEHEVELLKRLYPNTYANTIANILKKPVSSIYDKAHKLQLKKHPEFLKNNCRFKPGTTVGLNTQFKKGIIPHNKGKKMNPEVYKKLEKTMFKQGNIPHNKKNIGDSRITKDGYIEVKIKDPNVYSLLHRYVYEKCFGPIPKGHNVQFKDGNKMNCNPSNLYVISRQEQMIKNSFLNLPEDIIEIIRIKARLVRKINQKSK